MKKLRKTIQIWKEDTSMLFEGTGTIIKIWWKDTRILLKTWWKDRK